MDKLKELFAKIDKKSFAAGFVLALVLVEIGKASV
jgi:tetrahydromethanopterin S-methyltransferase subunit F